MSPSIHSSKVFENKSKFFQKSVAFECSAVSKEKIIFQFYRICGFSSDIYSH